MKGDSALEKMFQNVKSKEEIHSFLNNSLNFLNFYGVNMSAFSDVFAVLVEMPKVMPFQTTKSILEPTTAAKSIADYSKLIRSGT